MAVLAVGLILRYGLVGVAAGPTERYSVPVVFWCFALGWGAAKATRWWERVAVSGVSVLAVLGFFGDLPRELVVALGPLLLVWLPVVRLPKLLAIALGVVASSSLYVYLTHWQVYPYLEDRYPLLAVAASFGLGIVYWRLTRPLARELGRLLRGGPRAQRRAAVS